MGACPGSKVRLGDVLRVQLRTGAHVHLPPVPAQSAAVDPWTNAARQLLKPSRASLRRTLALRRGALTIVLPRSLAEPYARPCRFRVSAPRRPAPKALRRCARALLAHADPPRRDPRSLRRLFQLRRLRSSIMSPGELLLDRVSRSQARRVRDWPHVAPDPPVGRYRAQADQACHSAERSSPQRTNTISRNALSLALLSSRRSPGLDRPRREEHHPFEGIPLQGPLEPSSPSSQLRTLGLRTGGWCTEHPSRCPAPIYGVPSSCDAVPCEERSAGRFQPAS